MTITAEEAMKLVPADDFFIVSGISGETPTHWVIARDPVFDGDDLDAEVPLVDKESGEVFMAVPHIDFDLFEGLTETS